MIISQQKRWLTIITLKPWKNAKTAFFIPICAIKGTAWRIL